MSRILPLILLAIGTLLISVFYVPAKLNSMGDDIRAELVAQNVSGVNVEMKGNVAHLTGELANSAAVEKATMVAENTKCSECAGKKSWHKVQSNLTTKPAPTIPTQSPYTFSGLKAEDGTVTLSGYVANEDTRAAVFRKARTIFDGPVLDDKVRIALGQPDGEFANVTETYMKELALLDQGRFSQEGFNGLINGKAASADIRSNINEMGSSLPGQYGENFAANISVIDMDAESVGEVKSETICQTLFDDLKGNNRILFATDRAQITGAESFDLLNNLSDAAKQCNSFRVEIDGHTDNVGNAAYNMDLSQKRAETVKAYLIENDVAADRMTTKGFGETDPRAPNDTEEGRALNRRINFTVTRAE